MPIKKLPINFGANFSIDEVGHSTNGAVLMDGYVDSLGNVNKRFGLTELCDLDTGAKIDGIFWWDRQSCFIAVSGGECHKITDNIGTNSQITGATFATGTRPTFADYGTALYSANGGQIIKIGTGSTMAVLADGDAPTTVTHVATLDKYLIANETSTEKFHFSDVADPDAWTGDFASSESRPDLLVALGVLNLELHLMGKRTLEVYRNDGSTPFVRESQGFVQSGTVAPYTFVLCGTQWLWLDDMRNVMRLVGRTPQVFSNTLNKYIQGFSTVSDALGDYLVIDGRPFYVLHFPIEEKTIVCDLQLNMWYEWGYWDSVNSEHDRFRGNCGAVSPAWNMTVIGDRATGKVYKINSTSYDDDGDDVRMLLRTPQIDQGTSVKRKSSEKLIFRLKKPTGADVVVTPSLSVRWRSDGSTSWNNARTVPLGASGQTEFIGRLRQLGQYTSRQYEVAILSSIPIALVSIEEEFNYI